MFWVNSHQVLKTTMHFLLLTLFCLWNRLISVKRSLWNFQHYLKLFREYVWTNEPYLDQLSLLISVWYTDTEAHRQTHGHRPTETQTHTYTGTHTDTHRHSHTHTGTHRDKHIHTQRHIQIHLGTHTHRHTQEHT